MELKMEPKLIKAETFDQYVKEGWLSKSELDNLILFNYTDATTWSQKWDDITLNSRGTIYNKDTFEVVGLSLPKFFNLNEHECTRFENLPFNEGFVAYEKMDGSLGCLFRHKGQYRIATRGSFYSEQSKKATEMLKKYDLSSLKEDHTLLFEIIYPENQIVIPYGDREELVLLAAFNYKKGKELAWEKVVKIAERCGFSLPKIYNHTFEQLLKLKDEIKWNESEGWVLRFNNGLRVKVKGSDYLRIAKIKSQMSPLAFWDAMVAGKADEYIVSIPEELRAEAEEIYGTLKKQVNTLRQKADSEAQKLNLIGLDINNKELTKQMASQIITRPDWMKGYLFGAMRGKASDDFFLKVIRPTDNVYVDLASFK